MPDLKSMQHDVDAERAQLANSLDTLAAAVHPDTVKTHAADLFDRYGSDIGRQAWSAASSNPAAFALVGAGIGLLLTGAGARKAPTVSNNASLDPEQALIGFDERVRAADAEMQQQSDAVANQQPRAAWLRTKIEDGLESLSPAARTRVRAAREAAISAQEKVEQQAAAVAAKSKTAMVQKPLAVGAVAAGLGALVAAVLPATRKEDALMGAHRDAMMAAAKSALNDEMDKAHIALRSKLGVDAEQPEARS